MIKLNLPKAQGLFVTGTDTGIGKTLIAGAIAQFFVASGKRVAVFKPVASGCRKTREGLISEDAEFLAYCANSEFPLSVINPVTFELPAAPILCEQVEGRKVDFEQIGSTYKYICENSDVVIVEGIGGIRVPISKDVDVLDLTKAFDLPVIIVARPDLGTINHTLLTIDAVRDAGLTLAGIVINRYDESKAELAEKTAPEIIAQCRDVKILTVAPYDPAANVKEGVIGEQIADAMSSVDWNEMI